MEQQNERINDDEIDLGALTKVLWHRKWFIITFVILTSLLAAVLIKQIPNVYQSSVLIMFKKSAQSADPLQSLITGSINAADNTETELELIKSRRFASQIVDKLHLDLKPEFNITAPEDRDFTNEEFKAFQRQSTIDKILANISVKQKSDTELISISYTSTNPQLAAEVANEIGSNFVIFKEQLMAGKHKAGSTLIVNKIKAVQKSLDNAEFNIIEYQNEHDFIDIKSAISFSNTKLVKMHAQKQVLDTEIEQSNILKSHILNSKNDVDSLLAIPILAKSTIVNLGKQEIKSLQNVFDKIKLRYGKKHPKYIEADRLLNDAELNLLSEIDKQVSQIDKQLHIYKDNLTFIEKEIGKHSLRLRQLGVIEFDYQKLKREFDSYLTLYEALVKKQNESDLMQDLNNTSNTILVETAEVPNAPVKPRRKLMLVLSTLGSAMIAVIIVFIEVMLGDKVIQFRRVALKFGTKVIGTVPKIKLKKSNKNEVLTHLDRAKHSGFIEAIRSIRTNILLDKHRSKQKVIAITSINPNDGKSSLSIQLADCFSELENVLLIDADLRFPSIAKALGEDPDRPGLTNLIAKSHTLEQSVIKQEDYNFEVIPSGNVPKNPLVFLSNPRLQKIITFLKSKYERVILECPPIMSVSDAFVISKHVDSVYLVIDAEKTDTNMLGSVLEELQQANVVVGGILVNKIKESNNYYSSKYYSRQYIDSNKVKVA